MGVGIPYQLDDIGPAGRLLHLVDHQQGSGRSASSPDPGQTPLLFEPCLIPQAGLVGRGIMRREAALLRDLADQCGFPHLPGTRQNLDETTGFAQPGKQLGVEIGSFCWIYSGQ